MNSQLIEKVIKSTDLDSNASLEFTYENPLLDINIAGALARSFVKILRDSQQDSKINNNARHSVLFNIRKICRIEPENHLEVDENFTNSLVELYINQIEDRQVHGTIDFTERNLDDVLLRTMKDIDLNCICPSSMNPEVLQALLNLTGNHPQTVSIKKDILHWNITNKKNLSLVKYLWTNSRSTEGPNNRICDDISIKMKSEIEKILLDSCHSVITDPNLHIEKLFSLKHFTILFTKCSISAECFQICVRILNYLFINSNFNLHLQIFISKFIQNVKKNCMNISVLYPVDLRAIVVLLDINLNGLPNHLKNKYLKQTLLILKNLHDKSESDLVLLLSHFPSWFDLYFN